MDLIDIAKFRLASQQIAGTRFKTPRELVGWMGAIQAQDYAMAKFAVGARLAGSTDHEIEAAIDSGEILRTHLMRPTWHLVSADDIYWMLDLTAQQVKSVISLRHVDMGLTDDVIAKSNSTIVAALKGGNYLTRDELVTHLKKARINTADNRSSHLIAHAELDGLICSGATRNGKPTYAILEERVPRRGSLTREEALAKLAGVYFSSHGPASLQDFAWWSGLPVGEARRALEMIKSSLNSDLIAGQTYWFAGSPPSTTGLRQAYLLPAYDEFLISYADRRAALPEENFNNLVSSNGIFRPCIVLNGQVTGVWKRALKNDQVIVEMEFFKPVDKAGYNLVEEAAAQFGRFMEKKVEINLAGKIEPLKSKGKREF